MNWRRLPWLLAGAVLFGVALGLAFVLVFGLSGAVRYRDIPVVVLPVPPASPGPAEAALAPSAQTCSRPCVAILVTELGHAQDIDQRVEEALPEPVGLVFQPYAKTLGEDLSAARQGGHEVLVELPLQPDAGTGDAGPSTILISQASTQGPQQLDALLAEAQGIFGVAATAGAFGGVPQQFAPLAGEIARRDLALIELGGSRLLEVAGEAGLPSSGALGPLDLDPAPAAIDAALVALEAAAREKGSAIGFARPLPVTVERLRAWIAGLDARGISLVAPSVVLAHAMGKP